MSKALIRGENGGITLAGRIIKDVDAKPVGQNNTLKASFGVAVGNRKDNDDEIVNVVAWREDAEYAATLRKGDIVAVIGTESSREYNGKTYTDITPVWMAKKPTVRGTHAQSQSAPPQHSYEPMSDMQEIDEDMPF